jgi:putative DNA primase/helicase
MSPETDYSGVTEGTGVTATNDAASDVTPPENTGVTEVTIAPAYPHEKPPADTLEPDIKRPGFLNHPDWFSLHGINRKPGLYWHGTTSPKGDSEPEPIDTWISTPLEAIATTQDEIGSGHGLILRYWDSQGRVKEWAAPMYMLKGSGEELRGELLDNGARINPKAQRLLGEWMMEQYPAARVVAATRTGWNRDNTAFVLPGRTIGDNSYRFQSEHAAHDAYMQRGTLESWRETVGQHCKNNPLLIVSVSCAFAAPLLKIAAQKEAGGAGLHLQGDSSKGKTTALQVAASVWGSPNYVMTWRGTGNGLEATAAARNDTLLPLDEISESNPKEIGAVIYALANGQGKQRARRTGGARESQRWRIMILSSGERTLSAHMGEANQKAKAGQNARLLSIPATNRRHGAFDHLHDHENARALADYLKQATNQNYGHAGPAFVAALLKDTRDLKQHYAAFMAEPEFTRAESIESRAAGTFALIAMAGELATDYGLTDWESGSAITAALDTFNAWRESRGKGQDETGQILAGIREFIAKHGSARFEPKDEPEGSHGTRDRAGYWLEDAGGRIYLFFNHALREAATGFDLKRILAAMDNAGWIADHDTGKKSKNTRIGNETIRLYWVRPDEGTEE